MKEHLTIGYITARKQPLSAWFLESLQKQISEGDKVNVVVVSLNELDETKICRFCIPDSGFEMVKPKPNIWQGEHRLTKQEWFAASNARNTALCLAPDGWIAFVDDLSVLTPGWLNCINDAMNGNYVVCGAYKKVKNLVVENGEVKSYTEISSGIDQRWQYAKGDPCPAERGWLFGCSCAMPVEALLTINGWPEMCDSIGFEDCCCGVALQNAGYNMMYDRRMLTLESEEHHHVEPALRREDWHFENGLAKTGGNGHDDCSHACLNIAEQSKWFPHYLGDGFADMRALRYHILNGFDFPVRKHPEHHWYSKLPLKDL